MQKQYTVLHGQRGLALISYIGSKRGFVNIFDELIPDHFKDKKIYDIFGGGGAFTFYVCNRFGSENIVYNDVNPVVTNLIRVLQKHPQKLWKEYQIHRNQFSHEYYYDIREQNLKNGIKDAGRFLFLAKNAFSGKIRFNRHGKFNAPIRLSTIKCPDLSKESVIKLSSIIKKLEITTLSFENFKNLKDSFCYLDPPYLNNPNGHYGNEFGFEEFIEFLDEIQKHNHIMLSEQNSAVDLNLTNQYQVYNVELKRSLQYKTQKNSHEIIAINY